MRKLHAISLLALLPFALCAAGCGKEAPAASAPEEKLGSAQLEGKAIEAQD